MTTAPIFGEVYVHTCTTNEKSYVGQTTRGMDARWREHIKERRNRAFSSAIRKYGADVFEHRILSVAYSQAELDNLERIWIILLQTKTPNGYNLTAGGEAGTLGYRHTPAALVQIAVASKGRKVGVAARIKLSIAHTGMKMPRDGVEKMAATKRGQPHILSPEGRLALSQKTSARLTGKKLSSEHRAHIGWAQKGKKQTTERKANTSKVMQTWWDARKKAQSCPAA